MKLALLTTFVASVAATSSENQCFLLNGANSEKPFPSLTQCYKNNQDACCVSAHDATIEGSYGGLLSSTCLREYQDLEHYFCLGCNPEMAKYIQWYETPVTGQPYQKFNKTAHLTDCDSLSGAEKTNCEALLNHKQGKYGMIKICPEFKDKLMYSDSSAKTNIDKYDNCGLNLGVSELGGASLGWLPSAHYQNNFYQFLSEIRPPYFGESYFDISVEDGSAVAGADYTTGRKMGNLHLDKWANTECFSGANAATVSLLVVAVSAILSLINM
jgi:hypothetical protein